MHQFFEGYMYVGDTETTGIAHEINRLYEVALVELYNGEPTGRYFHELVDPEQELEQGAQDVTGETRENIRWQLMKQGKYKGDKVDFEKMINLDHISVQKFADIAPALREFVGNHPVVFHNAQFDRDFIDNEFIRLGESPLSETNKFVCSLEIAKNHPTRQGRRNTLDQLAKDYKVSLDGREFHGALIDSNILVGVAKAIFEEKRDLGLSVQLDNKRSSGSTLTKIKTRKFEGRGRLIVSGAADNEVEAHKAVMDKIKGRSGSEMDLAF